MKKLLSSISLLVLVCSFEAHAQSRINLEMYFVPQRHHQSLLNDPSPSFDFATRTGLNLGLGLSYNISNDWQMVLQSWHVSSPLRFTQHPEHSGSAFIPGPQRIDWGFSYSNFSLGLRRIWEMGEYALYVQPSLGINRSRSFGFDHQDSLVNFPRANLMTQVVPAASIEVGMKFSTPSNNYFLVGLRHHQGFGMLQSWFTYSKEPPLPQVQRRGTYTGLVFGYGIDFRTRKGEDWRVTKKERKTEKREAAWGDGTYALFTTLQRFQPDFVQSNAPGMTRLRPASQILFGYTSGQWSFETGYTSWKSQTKVESQNFGWVSLNEPGTRAIPLRARYHLDVGQSNRLRVGVSAATFVTLNTVRMNVARIGAVMVNDERVPALRSVPTDQNSGGKLFYQAGAFFEIPFFNSSLLAFNFSQNFGSPEIGQVNVREFVNQQQVESVKSGTLDGFNIEVGLKLPISTLVR
ncbi:hypothetical protein A33Q_2028 [Indibacter alkaliphilus LW1]|uniref:DUF5723 domain-containing protein n=1 Tax=Indibacter alkaliphilus (strain CCUG 57479 / KCTC 22604 / LW1) TaxID=1189612 RepID=S2E3G7_INDAL|nr:hypothetical protein [Indibacter alkaliphilus]EOZ96718.1 hypothetical protein A33Q_2028 [Indibacter alkaliphilus LW1]